MGQPLPPTVLAGRVTTWLFQARQCHFLLRRLHECGVEVDIPGDGTVLVRLPYAEWRAACAEALRPPPEPLDVRTDDDTPAAQ